jgi:hypothetical protein
MKPKTLFRPCLVLSLMMAIVLSLFNVAPALAEESPLGPSPDWSVVGGQAGAEFGIASQAGDVNGDGYADVIVGAPNVGKSFAFYGSAAGLSTTPSWTFVSDQGGSRFGETVSTAGDVNGDGFDDVIVGGRYYNSGQAYEGKVFVYYGSASGLSATPNWTAENNDAYSEFGTSVGTAGDVNADGYDDVLIGSQYYNAHGRAYVYYGSASGLAATPAWTVEGTRWGGRFGGPSSPAGDVNADGYDDIIIGEPANDYGQVLNGRAYVYYGSAAGLGVSADWVVQSDQAGSQFGAVGAAGDVNADGYADVIIAASGYDNGQVDEGRVYVYYGSASGLESEPAWMVESDIANGYIGSSGTSTAGDVNGDGYGDVIVGAHVYDNGQTDEGAAFVYLGSASGLGALPAWTAEGNQPSTLFGFADTAGDVNGDGNADVIVGAISYDDGPTNQGAAFAYYGSGSQARLVASTTSTAIYPGDVIPVTLRIQNADQLYAAQANCAVAANILQPQEADFGDFFDATDRLIGINYADGASGAWTGAISQRSPALPLTGDGLFATVTYVAQGAGTGALSCDPLLADQNGFTQPVSFTGIDVTVLPFAVVSGTAQYQGRTDYSGITIIAAGPVTVTGTTDSAGNYVLNLRTGSYAITIGAPGYLTSSVTFTTISGETATLPAVVLKGGDPNGDNIIDIGDATLVAANFGLTVPPADARADINGDGIVNVQDLAIIGSNYGLSGD